jgi:hypothetical protein
MTVPSLSDGTSIEKMLAKLLISPGSSGCACTLGVQSSRATSCFAEAEDRVLELEQNTHLYLHVDFRAVAMLLGERA